MYVLVSLIKNDKKQQLEYKKCILLLKKVTFIPVNPLRFYI